MTSDDHDCVAQRLNALIHDTLDLINRFEAADVQGLMADDYEKLQALLASATLQYRHHQRAALGLGVSAAGALSLPQDVAAAGFAVQVSGQHETKV